MTRQALEEVDKIVEGLFIDAEKSPTFMALYNGTIDEENLKRFCTQTAHYTKITGDTLARVAETLKKRNGKAMDSVTKLFGHHGDAEREENVTIWDDLRALGADLNNLDPPIQPVNAYIEMARWVSGDAGLALGIAAQAQVLERLVVKYVPKMYDNLRKRSSPIKDAISFLQVHLDEEEHVNRMRDVIEKADSSDDDPIIWVAKATKLFYLSFLKELDKQCKMDLNEINALSN